MKWLRNFFFFNDTATTEIYTLSLHDALPISGHGGAGAGEPARLAGVERPRGAALGRVLRDLVPRHGQRGADAAARRGQLEPAGLRRQPDQPRGGAGGVSAVRAFLVALLLASASPAARAQETPEALPEA